MEKPKVIILYNKIFHYRIPIWNILAEKCDLTVTFSEGNGKIPEGMVCKFKILPLPAWSFKERLVIQKANVRKLVRNYDVVIAYGDIAWLKYSTLPWFSKTKVIYHTIGVSASYTKGFDAMSRWDKIRAFFYNQADALVFYTDYPINKYSEMGMDSSKMFVADNTVMVQPINSGSRDRLLFIGTLYQEKGIQLLLDAYYQVGLKHDLPLLDIVGNGPDFEIIKKWINEHDLLNKIILHGAVYDPNEKAKFFANSLACISPLQAGLSVLESMGYGVPFITSKDAITGGELFNVHNGIDGIQMESVSQLPEVLVDICKNPDKYRKMGDEARKFYMENRTPEHMANGFWEAIQYVLNH